MIGLPDAWELQSFGTTAYGWTQDNDNDGANNLAEWAFNLTGTGNAQHLIVEFVRRKNAGLTYTVQFANSPGATSFQPAANAPTVVTIDANWERVVVDDNVTIDDQAIRFGRVRVTSP